MIPNFYDILKLVFHFNPFVFLAYHDCGRKLSRFVSSSRHLGRQEMAFNQGILGSGVHWAHSLFFSELYLTSPQCLGELSRNNPAPNLTIMYWLLYNYIPHLHCLKPDCY